MAPRKRETWEEIEARRLRKREAKHKRWAAQCPTPEALRALQKREHKRLHPPKPPRPYVRKPPTDPVLIRNRIRAEHGLEPLSEAEAAETRARAKWVAPSPDPV